VHCGSPQNDKTLSVPETLGVLTQSGSTGHGLDSS
jgi:hypothetical protein